MVIVMLVLLKFYDEHGVWLTTIVKTDLSEKDLQKVVDNIKDKLKWDEERILNWLIKNNYVKKVNYKEYSVEI